MFRPKTLGFLLVVLAVGAALVLGTVLLVNAQLDRLAQPVFRQIHDLTAGLRVERPAVASKPRLAPLLQADIARGTIEVRDEPLRSVVSLFCAHNQSSSFEVALAV